MGRNELKVVSFSGIDGAGKSTQIDALCQCVRSLGLHCRVLTFWDDVVALSRFRERLSSFAFKGEQGVGSPDKPILRRDKNVAAWYVTAARFLLYLLDAISLCVVFSKNVESCEDFIIFDRYLYDELANLPLQHLGTRFFVRGLLVLVPKPDVALVLDAEPEAATVRKPEYPLDFVRRNRDAYLRLSRMAGMTVIPPLSVEESSAMIRDIVVKHCFQEGEGKEHLGLGLARGAAENTNR
jgi:thymidylate kinase